MTDPGNFRPEVAFDSDPMEIVKHAILRAFENGYGWSIHEVLARMLSPVDRCVEIKLAVKWHDTDYPQGRTQIIRVTLTRES